MNRFKDPGSDISAFVGAALVVCPRCSGCAVSRPRGGGIPDASTPRRVSCTACPLSGERESPAPARGRDDARDPFFRLPLWLQTPCCGAVLWALNEDHLAFLEGYVGADLRQRAPDDAGWSNRSTGSRLPLWIKSAKNREAVLKGLAKLRERLREVRGL
ncbi:MAG: TFIIB-type zinc ribbon-containing protein [Elusimicrobia bacterium]|nr:TFIIB-type zinc ribbon-containing protein [Elusimicrobiota bacterium]